MFSVTLQNPSQILTQSLKDACLNVLQMTREIQLARNITELLKIDENLSSLHNAFMQYELRLLTLPYQEPKYWPACKQLQELAGLIQGYEQALNLKRTRLMPKHFNLIA